MKIAIIQPRISYYNGGGERLPLQFIKELTNQTNIKVDLYTLKAPFQETLIYSDFKRIIDNIKVRILEYKIPIDFRYLYDIEAGENRYRWDAESLFFNSQIFPDLLKNGYDLLWSYYIYDGITHPLNSPSILNLIGYPREKVPYQKAIIDQFTATISISNNVAQKWQIAMGANLKNNFISRPAVKVALEKSTLNRKIFNHCGPNIVFAGRIIKRKGLTTLIDALALLRNKYPTIKVYILGDGPFKKELIEYIEHFHLKPYIIFLGHKENVGEYFANADACVFPSEEGEGLMGVVLEAMYCGGAIITTKSNGNEEIIVDQKEGLIIEPNNKSALAKAIDFIISNPTWSKEVKIRAIRRAQTDFTWEKHISSIEQIINEVMSSFNSK